MEAKSILKKQGADYTNLSLDSDSEAGKYATNIMAFPTTPADRNGNIVGDPIMGGITSDEVYKKVTAAIDQILEKDAVQMDTDSGNFKRRIPWNMNTLSIRLNRCTTKLPKFSY